ncbi:hypothetical protein BDN67DRAFT_972485 [Paxillus ammoniavirescens]|nr:hypothetical protein BDN67DRAFT_972485 [Paxillus ammoniavirescens]
MVPVVRQFAKGACPPPTTKQTQRPGRMPRRPSLSENVVASQESQQERGRRIMHVIVCTRDYRNRVHT